MSESPAPLGQSTDPAAAEPTQEQPALTPTVPEEAAAEQVPKEAAAEQTPEETDAEQTPEETDAQQVSAAPAGPDYLRMALESGVAPLEMRFAQINSSYRRLPIAYRSFTYVNSVTEGILPPEKYAFAADVTDRGIRLAKWNVLQAIDAIRRFDEAGRHVRFVTARCPARLALVPDLYEWMRSLMEQADFHTPERLCLEFPQSLLYEDEEAVRMALLNMKLLKVPTMMTGCGARDCPVTSLINLPVDYVVLAPWLTALTDSRNKGASVLALLAFLRSLPVEVIGDGVRNDNQIAAFSRSDCLGYIPSPDYEGAVSHGRLRMTLDEAIAQNEEEI
jgi:EAL domain-containing protein (putative c-di-GMP-specific phosphodiesterase class I)